MTENDGTQGPQRPLPEDEGQQAQERQEPPARPLGDRTVVFGAPQLGGQPGLIRSLSAARPGGDERPADERG